MTFSRFQKAKRASFTKDKKFNLKNIDKNSKSAEKKHRKTSKTPNFVKNSEKSSNIFNFSMNQAEFSAQVPKINLNDF